MSRGYLHKEFLQYQLGRSNATHEQDWQTRLPCVAKDVVAIHLGTPPPPPPRLHTDQDIRHEKATVTTSSIGRIKIGT